MRNNPIFDRLFGMDGIHPFGNPFRFEEYLSETFESFEDLKEEVVEIEKGNYKTIIRLKFNKEGFPVTHSVETYSVQKTDNSVEILKKELTEAIEAEDYPKAAEICRTIKDIENKTKTN